MTGFASSKRTFVVLFGLMASAAGYSTSSVPPASVIQTSWGKYTKPKVEPLDRTSPTNPRKEDDSKEKANSSSSQAVKRQRQWYDLGLGKHPPVTSKKNLHDGSWRYVVEWDVDTVTQYLVEHNAVIQYAAPTKEDAEEAVSTSALSSKSLRKARPIMPTRLSGDDVLTISENTRLSGYGIPKKSNSQPTVLGLARTRELDLNTPWVEMLIHEQRRKHVRS